MHPAIEAFSRGRDFAREQFIAGRNEADWWIVSHPVCGEWIRGYLSFFEAIKN